MEGKDIRILYAQPEDAEELLGIYRPYVEETAVSFEIDAPDTEEFRRRIAAVRRKYPYLKAVDAEGRILGYAYAGCFKDRAAYDWSVETTVYIRRDQRRSGIGKLLYTALEEALSEMGILNMNACIALPKGEDPYLTADSVYFHEKMGFATVGIFHDSGYKFRRWYDMIWMEKMIGEHTAYPKKVLFGKTTDR